MRIGYIVDSLMVLLTDGLASEEYLNNNPESQFARRTYVRSIFVTLEGSIWILKKVCFYSQPKSGHRVMTAAEFALLREESYELKGNGETSTSTKFLKLPDNIKFTFKMINKLFRTNIDLGVGSKSWEEFLQALAIRNRITHPKNTTAFNITDDEIEVCKRVSGYFNTTIHASMEGFLKSGMSEEASINEA